MDFDVDNRPFTDDFTLLQHKEGVKFDFVLMCHSAYYFKENLEAAITHAHSFVKPGGTLLLVTEAGRYFFFIVFIQ